MKAVVRSIENKDLESVLLENNYFVKRNKDLLFVSLKDIQSKVLIVEGDYSIFFELDLIRTSELNEDIALYKELLDLNTEILPISIAIDSTDLSNERLVLNESLPIENLDENELLRVIETMELSLSKVSNTLKKYVKKELR